jgi:virulence factor
VPPPPPPRLRVGVIGLGDIAQKAYLPVLTAREDVDLTLMTRNVERLAQVSRRYGVPITTTNLDQLLEDGVDAAFVHASTSAHVELVERLLTAGVHVLVDKPLAPTFAEASHLVQLAETQAVSLAVGFNRRFAPAYAALAGLQPAVVLMEKNRPGLPAEPRQLVFDDFVHVVDTVRFLMPPGEEETHVWCSVADGLLTTVTLALRVGSTTGLGVMHRVSGSQEETLEILGDGYKHRVLDVAETWHAEARDPGGVRHVPRDSWTSVPEVRGFTAMCDAFLGAVRSGQVLSARDALRTHEVCEQVVTEAVAAERRGRG